MMQLSLHTSVHVAPSTQSTLQPPPEQTKSQAPPGHRYAQPAFVLQKPLPFGPTSQTKRGSTPQLSGG
jgi:hypothetical protein